MRANRATAALAVLALVVGACCGEPATAARGSIGRAGFGPGVRQASADAESPEASAPANTPIAIGGSTAAPGQTEIRWYCCLGGGDAPEQVDGREAGRRGLQLEPTPTSTSPSRPSRTRAPTTPSRPRSQSGNGPDIVGPVGIGGANAFHGQWLDLAPLIEQNNYDLSGFPPDAVDIYKLDEGQVGIPFAIYPSVLFYSQEPVRGGGPQRAAAQVRRQVHDARRLAGRLDVRHGRARSRKILTVDKNGKDATDPAFDPQQHRPVGLRAPARRPARHGRLLRRRVSSRPRTARPPRSRTRGRPPGSY